MKWPAWLKIPRRAGSRRRQAARATSTFADSTLASAAWVQRRRAVRNWGIAGAVVGALVAVPAFAPAAWLSSWVASATGGRVLLADARGTLWAGSAVLVLTGGPDSRDASALPGRLQWQVGLSAPALTVRLEHACCLNGTLVAQVHPGIGSVAVSVPAQPGGLGQWPAAWLNGLGTPFNTVQLAGTLRASSTGARIEWVQGRIRLEGSVELELAGMSSRMVPLETVGSYRVGVSGGAGSDGPVLMLSTLVGPLRLGGTGQWTGGRLRFAGEATAEPGSEAALDNLLNVIGRRAGARSIISIG